MRVIRRIEFCAGHTLMNHESKCRNLHGHNYVAHITCEAESLDEVGRVIDFSVIKEEVKGWIDKYWDHKFLINRDDPRVGALQRCGGKDLVLVPYNPTAENMAADLFVEADILLSPLGVSVVKVVLEETPNCRVEYDGK